MAVRLTDFSGWSFAERRGFLRLNSFGSGEARYEMGEFMHPKGIVTVYRQEDYTSLQFVHGERIFCRQWDAYWGSRTINKLARQFVADVLEGIIK